MLRGIYIASTGMLTQRKRMDVTSNNIVNAETKGFKKDTLNTTSFDEVLVQQMNGPNAKGIGTINFGIHVDDVETNYQQGALEQTNSETDLSINGDGFFVVQTPQGLKYTRSGHFCVDQNGMLKTQEGYQVMGVNGPIHVGTKGFTVDKQGRIFVGQENVNSLRIVQFTNPQNIVKFGDNLFEGQVVDIDNSTVLQGFLENSNVDIGQEMVDMIEIQRSYEANQRVLKFFDESLGKAVNDVGRI